MSESAERPAAGSAAGETPSRRDLFLGLIHSFQAAAMQQMGKMPNPFTNQIERDLAQARLSIDMLEMLEERTHGNLTSEEGRFLAHVLTELRLNFVQESAATTDAPASPDAPTPPDVSEPPEEPPKAPSP